MKITFIPSDQETANLIPRPKPAASYLPDWYKQAKPIPKCPAFNSTEIMGQSFKDCMPFRDATTFGYIQETWCDIIVESTETDVNYFHALSPSPLSHRATRTIPISETLNPLEMLWIFPWIPKLPKGYSMLVTSPLNRLDLPFTVTAGVVDADTFFHIPNGVVPFYFHKNFHGVVPAGTPMFQIIPFKRDNWESKTESFDAATIRSRQFSFHTKVVRHYKEKFWQRKRFT